MSHRVTARSAMLFGGLVAPRIQPGAEASTSELFRFLRERIRDRSPAEVEVNTVFVPDEHGVYNAVMATAYASPADVPVGEVFVSVPSGVYAVFVPDGSMRDPIEDVWTQVEEATANGELFRAYKEDIEVVTTSGEVELYISIVI
ncbi:effector binding domain-containing protein [Rhodococcus sp. G-MC3]|uniref:effector binding domain-containing protein n=1 Tax=Rhodococcus sp. G-MC3 TaxID=3046209 RepID=UPI0024B89534|nr:effector binding domain-containing protein [Rhodococcus sp. G-MC3]MDJ0393980.1 effector binding domain-containing protein [Rhodococcus sp. G-MC3]